MTVLGTILSFYPALCVGLAIADLLWFAAAPSWQPVLAMAFLLYGFPLFSFRLHNLFFPLKEGISRLDEPKYSPWWGSHQIQLLYISFPSLETMLRLIPGAFSLWLRLWGSRVGRGVYWTPLVQILDRSLLEIGDHCVFGHQVNCSGHVIKPSAERMILFVRKVRVGNGVFIGAGSRLGPGAYVEDKVQLPALTDLFVNKRATAESIEETE